MTVIVGYHGTDGIYMAADQRSCSDNLIYPPCNKLNMTRDRRVCFAVSGSRWIAERTRFRMREDDAFAGDVWYIVEKFRKDLIQHGWKWIEDPSNDAPRMRFDAMLAIAGVGLYEIQSTFAIVEIPIKTFWATGGGYQYALGRCSSPPPEESCYETCIRAVEAAIKHDTSCGGIADVVIL